MGRTRGAWLFTYGVLITWSVVLLAPIYWVVTTSFKTRPAITGGATFVPWVDFQPSLQAWTDLFSHNMAQWGPYFGNSLVISVATAFLATTFGLMGGYALARWPRLGRFASAQFGFLLLGQRMFPAALLALPMLIMFQNLRLLDTHIGLIILYTAFGTPFAVWLLTEFIRSVPPEIEESAMIDGSSRLGVIFRITLPLVLPGLIGVFVLVLAGAWNEYFFALVLTFSESVTVPIFLANQINQTESVGWWYVSAIGIMSSLPLIVAALALQRFIQRGLVAGAVK
jgi:multiple sugar transport system permease protein